MLFCLNFNYKNHSRTLDGKLKLAGLNSDKKLLKFVKFKTNIYYFIP